MSVQIDLTNFDVDKALEVIWDALEDYRESSIPAGDELYDEVWDEICTAMAWIQERLIEEGKDEL